MLEKCMLCPRRCGVDRNGGEVGYCGMPADIYAARAALHFWEEPCLSGERGSGAVFFSGCSMGCVFCQNREISKGAKGKKITERRLAEIFLEQQKAGAHNINLVTPTHYAPNIDRALAVAKRDGLAIPVIYNSSGYENPDTVKTMTGNINIYLPDFKYMSEELSQRYSKASDYSAWAKPAIDEMVRRTGSAVFDSSGMMMSGVIVRHMILPGQTKDSVKIIEYLHKTYGDSIYMSIMNQYTPVNTDGYAEINRAVSKREYDRVINYAVKIGVENAFIQEGGTVSESFIPAFDYQGI